jgi:DNA-binding response OmpR family regulator
VTSTEEGPSRRPPRIVVVDDEPNLLAGIAMILERENYRVFAADGALKALRHLRAHGADLLLSDVRMPDVDGFTLVEWLRADPALMHIPIILFTSAHEEARALRLGVFDYICKPVGRSELLERVFRGVCVGVLHHPMR